MQRTYAVCISGIAFLLFFSGFYYATFSTNSFRTFLKHKLRGDFPSLTESIFPTDSYSPNINNSVAVTERYVPNTNNSISVTGNSSSKSVPHELEKKLQKKLILAYTTVYGWSFNIGTLYRSSEERKKLPNPLAQCKYSCSWSTDRRLYNQSDAVLFHLYNNHKNYDFVYQRLPARQSLEQKWILMAREPQAFFQPEQLRLLENKFNLTMTFQSSSDVPIPYGKYWPTTSQHPLPNLSRKKKLVLWMVSNCATSSNREKYVKELLKYIDIDIFGDCLSLFKNMTSKHVPIQKVSIRDYKFYLAFENSDCDEYITEKFWNNLAGGMIPVVRGQRAKYEQLAPPDSYIHADNFSSAEGLASYLKQVASNPKLFLKYHQWRNKYSAGFKMLSINAKWMCDLCEKVHISPTKTVSIYDQFSEDKMCNIDLDSKNRNRTGERIENLLRL